MSNEKEKISKGLLIRTITLPMISALAIFAIYNEGVIGKAFGVVIGISCMLGITGVITQKPKWWFRFLKKY